MQQGAIGSDQVNRAEVVAGEAVLARQEPEPATEDQARDADARTGPGGQGEVPIPETTVEIAQSHPCPDDRFAALAVDVDSVQSAQVDDQSIVEHRERLVAVPTGASAQRHALLARPTDGVLDIPRVATDDDGGRKARKAAIEVRSRFVIVGVPRPDDAAGQFGRDRSGWCGEREDSTRWVGDR